LNGVSHLEREREVSASCMIPDVLGLYGQVNKRIWWMPRR
jgi:hypothetical protein